MCVAQLSQNDYGVRDPKKYVYNKIADHAQVIMNRGSAIHANAARIGS